MDTTRDRILAYLKSHQAATATEVSRALDMTASNARHHLAILLRQRQVEIIGARPSAGSGRPSKLYSLAHTEETLYALITALLKVIVENQPPDQRLFWLKALAREIGGSPTTQISGLTGRLVAAVQQLNQLGYRARWEAHADLPRLTLGSCPYAAIIDQHPELCQVDAFLLENLLEHPVEQIEKLQPNPQGIPVCIFRISERGLQPSPSLPAR